MHILKQEIFFKKFTGVSFVFFYDQSWNKIVFVFTMLMLFVFFIFNCVVFLMSVSSLFYKPIPRDCLYPVSTESGHDVVIGQLKNLPVLGDAVLGVSGLATLNLSAIREGISDVYVFDIANSVSHFWTQILPILAECEEADQAAQKIEEVLLSFESIYFKEAKLVSPFNMLPIDEKAHKAAELAIGRLRAEIGSYTSFLSDPIRYSRIHTLAKEGRIHFYQGDLADPRNKDRILNYFRTKGIVFDTIYLSNIEHCLSDLRSVEAFPKFTKGLESLSLSIPHKVAVDECGRQQLIRGRGNYFGHSQPSSFTSGLTSCSEDSV